MPSTKAQDNDHPVEYIGTESQSREPERGIALCLSGGGYRAMLFHVGALWRLYDSDILKDVARISSVSGGSITAGQLGLKWSGLSFDPALTTVDFVPEVVEPIRSIARHTIDRKAVLKGIFLPGSIENRVAKAYRKHLYNKATLQDLPDTPRFVINATNVQSGALWRFMKPYMRDYRVGEVKNPQVTLADAVAASSAFPPILSPIVLNLVTASFTPGSGTDLQREPYTSRVVLSDGGVYDNLGLETAWKRYRTVLVSDAGGKLQPEGTPARNWAGHSYRVLNLIDNQVRSLRKRQLISSYISGVRDGAFWGIRTDIADYNLPQTLPCPFDRSTALANMPTRLKALPDKTQEKLINWGYAVCDAALRRHVDQSIPVPLDFPYPKSGV